MCYLHVCSHAVSLYPLTQGKYTWRDGLAPLEGLFGFGYDYGTGG